jgi:hypothetical protein
METNKEIRDYRVHERNIGRVSWPAIFAGTLIMLIVLMLLSLLGLGIGLGSINPAEETHPMQGLGTGTLIWWVISNLIAVFIGAFACAHLTNVRYKYSGIFHGVLSWCLYTLISFWLMTTAVGGIISGVGGAVSKSISGIGLGLSKAGSMAGQVDTNPLKQMLQGALHQDRGGNDSIKPFDVDIMAVVQDVFIRDGKFRTDVSRQEVERSIARNSTLSQADVQRATDTIMSKYQNFQQRLPEIKQKAEVTAQKTADVASKAAIWSFIALLLGLITAGFGGRSGEPVYRRDQFENEVI